MKKLTIEEVRGGRGACLDFVVEDRPLLHMVEARGFDLVPRTGTPRTPIDLETRVLLLLEAPGDTVSGRVGLYVCPLCRDYGCGVVSARISRVGDDYVWSDFVYETNLPADEPVSLENVGPFRFDGESYRRKVNGNAR
jgi:hypothetical protein